MAEKQYKTNRIGCHASHCCLLHGCKYGDDNCPVVTKKVEQEYLCEACGDVGIQNIFILKDIINGTIKCCPHCGAPIL